MNIVKALQYTNEIATCKWSYTSISKPKIIGIVGRDGGYTKRIGDAVIVIPTVNEDQVTPLTEGFQSIIWHLLVSHPKLKINETKW